MDGVTVSESGPLMNWGMPGRSVLEGLPLAWITEEG
jgi:hypothetical protein